MAEDTLARIRREWDEHAPQEAGLSPLERPRAEYRALFRHTVTFPEFHRFMRQEATWRIRGFTWWRRTKNVLKPLISRLLPQIKAAQAEGQLPPLEPILFPYLMVSLTSALSAFVPEMKVTRRLSADRQEVVNAYWSLVEETVYGLRLQVAATRTWRRV